MSFLYAKAAHIVFVVTWFSGMFYLVRLFIYNQEAENKPKLEKEILHNQFKVMIMKLLYMITLPSACLTLLLGLWLLLQYEFIPNWLWVKICFVLLLYAYQVSLHIIAHQQAKKMFKYSSKQLRFWNEVPTLILISVVLLVVFRDVLSLFYGLVGVIIFGVLTFVIIKMLKKIRRFYS